MIAMAANKIHFPIRLPTSADVDLFIGVLNGGIDAHGGCLTKTCLRVMRGHQLVLLEFFSDEADILLRRLRENGSSLAEGWAKSIEAELSVAQKLVTFTGELHGLPGSPFDRLAHGDFSLERSELANLEIVLRSKIELCNRDGPNLGLIGQLLNFIQVHPVRFCSAGWPGSFPAVDRDSVA